MQKTKKIFKGICLALVVAMMLTVSSLSADLKRDSFGHPILNELTVASPDGLVDGVTIYDTPGGNIIGFAVPISDGKSVLAVPRRDSGALAGYEVALSAGESVLIVPRRGTGVTERVELTFSNGKELSITLPYILVDGLPELQPLEIPFFDDEGVPCSADEIYAQLSMMVGCGNQIYYYTTESANKICCQTAGGTPNCVKGVNVELYRCNPSCLPSGSYTGYVYKCGAGHTLTMGGLIMGAHY
ncbi:MAG: hypothetical protein FWD23_07020 [Oscillospiraceae bacterium]|nr:hypothetical protein [Oscillospiraceae bacterium]